MIIAGSERGQNSPLLYWDTLMISEKTISDIVHKYLQDNPKFLVTVKVTPQNKIMVFVDGDDGVTIDDCTQLSRHIEAQLDRDTEDFELQVSSVGVGQPLQLTRQYRNNIGRRLAVTGHDAKITKGRLTQVTDEGIALEKDKTAKGKKKKKEPDTDTGTVVFIPFEEIKEARVQVSFKRDN